ncbi:MAG TPA: phytanoyl-CoA dioxygenase family protein [Caulobacteraceae bacterium]|nr:phytanoyl-CoA dioxygenase family protein [Caulobacteraceae bacterium]
MADGAVAAVKPAFDAGGHVRRMREDGYTIVEGLMDADQIAAFRAGVEPLLGHYRGRNDFEGRTTERVYTLVARGKVYEQIVSDPRLLAILGAFLKPNFLLSASHAICIYPGEKAQSLHTDDAFYLVPRPRPALAVSVIGAVDDFTAENGATVVLPGTHRWGADEIEAFRDGRLPKDKIPEPVPLVMPAGSIAAFPGTLVHGAGANRSKAPRLGYTNQYCEPWLRTQENFYLAVPRDRVAAMAPETQSLLGYSITQPFLGMVTASHPAKTLDPGWTPAIVRQAVE